MALILFHKIAGMLLILAVGYGLCKWHLLESAQSSVLSVIMLYVVSPCLIVNAFQQPFEVQKLAALAWGFVVVILCHVLFIFLAALAARVLHLSIVDQMALIYSNGGNLIIPLIIALLGKEYILYSIPFLVVQLFLFWTHMLHCIDPQKPITLVSLLKNPNILAIAAGMVLFLSGFSLPALFLDACDSLAALAGPLSMLMIGMLCAQIPFKTLFGSLQAWLACAGRLVVFPAIFIVLLWASRLTVLLPWMQKPLLVSTLAICAPVAATLVQMSSAFGTEGQADQAAIVNVLSTLLCVLTMPLMCVLYETLI